MGRISEALPLLRFHFLEEDIIIHNNISDFLLPITTSLTPLMGINYEKEKYYPGIVKIEWAIRYKDLQIPFREYKTSGTSQISHLLNPLTSLRTILSPLDMAVVVYIYPDIDNKYNKNIEAKPVIELLEKYIEHYYAREFIINCYLVAIGFRPLYLLSPPTRPPYFSALVKETLNIFPSLVTRNKRSIIHNRLWSPPHDLYENTIRLGTLLRYEEALDMDFSYPQRGAMNWRGWYDNKHQIYLWANIVLPSTQLSQITNTFISLSALLGPLGIDITAELDLPHKNY